MDETKPKLSFISKQSRVRCEFTRAMCVKDPNGPEELIQRARLKMKEEKRAGRVVFYRVFATRLRAMWQLLAESNEPMETLVAVTICSGSPALPGLEFDVKRDGSCLGVLTFNATPETIRSWQHYYIKLTIGKVLRDADIKGVPDPAQVHRLWLRGSSGHKIFQVPVLSVPQEKPRGDNEPPFQIVEDRNHHDLTLIFSNVQRMRLKVNWDGMHNQLQQIADRWNRDGGKFEVQTENIVRTLRSALRGPERYGLDLPMVLLAGYDLSKIELSAGKAAPTKATVAAPKSAAATPAPTSKVKEESPASAPQKVTKANPTDTTKQQLPALGIDVSADGQTAVVKSFDLKWFEQFAKKISVEWVKQSLTKAGVVAGVKTEFLDAIAEKFKTKESIEGMQVGQGELPVAGVEPYLEMFPGAKHSEVADIRERQQKKFVRTGDVVAEIRYKTGGTDGFDVWGKKLAADRPPLAGVSCGEGVKANGLQFVAAVDGIPEQQGNILLIKRGLVHQGNVDLTSGNIRFVGDVEITGNVEQGSVVEVTGNVKIAGSITGADLRVKGNVSVGGGITNVQKGIIRVVGDLTASFAENSKMRVQGNINIDRNILGCEVYCTGSVSLSNKDGHVIGGKMYAEDTLSCAEIGRPSGTPTEIFVGCSAEAEFSLDLKNKRIVKLTAVQTHFQKELKQLSDRPTYAKTAKHTESIKEYEAKLKRMKSILKRANAQIEEAQRRVRLNKDAKVLVNETLHANTRITVAGKKFVAKESLAGVAIVIKNGAIKPEPIESIKPPETAATPPAKAAS